MKRGRPLTREESQARTREIVLEAAEELFLAQGFHGTTVAQIALHAGRTQGSIYGHFASKEALCLAVLERHYAQSFGQLYERIDQAGELLDDRLHVLAEWWRGLSANEPLTILVAEYALTARRDPEKFAELTGVLSFVRTMLASVLVAALDATTDAPDPDTDIDAIVNAATAGLLSTGVGLALGQVLNVVDTDESAAVLTETTRLWSRRVQSPS